MQYLIKQWCVICAIVADIVSYIKFSEPEDLSIYSINEFIKNKYPSFLQECNRLDSMLTLYSTIIDPDKVVLKSKKYFDLSFIDSMGYFLGYFNLNTHLLNLHTKYALYDGKQFDINLNSFYGTEQLVLGTSLLKH